MKRKVRISLASVCAVIITICCLALGLYTFGYMGFEDGKLRFYFGKNIDNPDNPSNPDTPNTPDEPDDPISTKYTINLVFPDGKTEKYTYDPAKEEFNANSYYTNWISTKEKTGGLYRFDNWYLDEFYHDLVDLKKLKDGYTLYAKMVEQVAITIHGSAPQSSETKTVAVDKNSIFKIENYITSTAAELMEIYSDEAKTQKANSAFLATKSQEVYTLWSTPYSSFTWNVTTAGATITKYTGSDEKVIIPRTYISNNKRYSVVEIKSGSFTNSQVTSLVISSNITKIGEASLPGASKLQDITVEEGNKNYYTSGNCLIDKTTKTLLSGGNNSVIPTDGSVTSIADEAFKGCIGLTSITIPDSVTSIGYDAFYGCAGLTSIVISNSVTSIGYDAFDRCTGLTTITPNKMMVEKEYAFTSLLSTYFSDSSKITTVIIPDGVTSIGDFAFYNGTNLTSIIIPDSVISIGSSTFQGCTGLTSIAIGNGVTSIGDSAFYDCGSLTSVTIPNSVTNIGDSVFSACYALMKVNITNLVNWCKIDFSDASSNPLDYAKNLYLNDALVTNLVIPEEITEIKKYAFQGCSSLTSITIPDSVTKIGDYAFWNCSSLTSITIPNSVISIGKDVFRNCTSLTSITIKATTPPTFVANVFEYCYNLTAIYVPSGSVEAYKAASGWSAYKNLIKAI